ncbi:MAG: hypothetical protein CO118_01480 [Flavobacteriales bacterium CG_4_9_14_3_um_filter_32_8]|nr:MAG: hypothetical protein CO118_01480 [Flavobacteriales bacterium CG_4_9_14_3_um_filter_32_8]
MKYRCLTSEELKELEQELKHFLIANHVYTEEWAALNKKKDKRVQELIELFSDVVLEKALKNINCIEQITPNEILFFKFDDISITLIGISSTNKKIDFTKDSLDKFKNELTIFKTSKVYQKERTLEVFQLLQSGCSISDEERFKKLELAYTYSLKQAKN